MLKKIEQSEKFVKEINNFRKKVNLVSNERIKMNVEYLIAKLETYVRELDNHYDTRNNGYIRPSLTSDLRFNINQIRLQIEKILKDSI